MSRESPRRVTIEDVAKKAGVSKAAASMGLRGSRKVSSETRQRLLHAAAQLGYHPDPFASSLGLRRAREVRPGQALLAMISCGNEPKDRPVLVFEEQTVRGRAEELGYELEWHHVLPDELRPLIRELIARGCIGVIVGRVFAWEPLANVDWGPLSVVSRERLNKPLVMHRARSDPFQGAFDLYNIAWDRGYRRIGCAPLRHSTPVADDDARLGGLLAAEALHVARTRRIPPFLGSLPGRPEGLNEWAVRHRLDCLLGFHPGLRTFHKLEQKIGFAALVLGRSMHHNVSGMVEQQDEISRAAVELLDQQIRLRITGLPERPREVVIPMWFDDRGTLPRVNSRNGLLTA